MSDEADDIEQEAYEIQFDKSDEKFAFVPKDGVATATFPNKDQYRGSYLNKARNGKGVYTFSEDGKASGAKYEGEYLNGKRHGTGTFVYPDKSKYTGQWKDGKRHGHGLYQYKNGDKYVGGWEFDQRAGNGTYLYASSQTQIFGRWVNGKCEDGTWSFYDDKEFVSQLSNQKIAQYLR